MRRVELVLMFKESFCCIGRVKVDLMVGIKDCCFVEFVVNGLIGLVYGYGICWVSNVGIELKGLDKFEGWSWVKILCVVVLSWDGRVGYYYFGNIDFFLFVIGDILYVVIFYFGVIGVIEVKNSYDDVGDVLVVFRFWYVFGLVGGGVYCSGVFKGLIDCEMGKVFVDFLVIYNFVFKFFFYLSLRGVIIMNDGLFVDV